MLNFLHFFNKRIVRRVEQISKFYGSRMSWASFPVRDLWCITIDWKDIELKKCIHADNCGLGNSTRHGLLRRTSRASHSLIPSTKKKTLGGAHWKRASLWTWRDTSRMQLVPWLHWRLLQDSNWASRHGNGSRWRSTEACATLANPQPPFPIFFFQRY